MKIVVKIAFSLAFIVLMNAGVTQAQEIGFRGFGEVGGTRFSSTESFTAVIGSPSGIVYGGGVEAVLPRGVFVSLQVSRFKKDGTRVFVFNNEPIDLGIATTVTVTPVEVTGGYRFPLKNAKVIPYVGAGVGWHRYEETSDFATSDEDVKATHQGYHVLGGAEVRLSRLFGVAGEAQWSTVPDALGENPNSVSAAFDESDLGGVTFRVRFIVGR
jgi:opacity protein-like surface antigen